MTFKKGDRVKLTTRDDWGTGQVKEIRTDGKLLIRFGLLGEKLLSPTANLQLVSDSTVAIGGLDRLVEYFLRFFPQGFRDPKYLDYERNYKVAAREELLKRMDRQELERAMQSGEFGEICSSALYLIGKTNLVNQFETFALKNSLIGEHQEKFARALYQSFYDESDLKIRFELFSRCLNDLNASKWTLQTYFLFLRFPESSVFLKPTESQKVADECGFELNYKPEVNWNTYSKWLALAESIHHSLVNLSQGNWTTAQQESLRPRDYIDVQSFVWTAVRLKEGTYLAG